MCKKLDYLNDYYVEVYDDHDNYIEFLENIENAARLFNKELKKILYAIRNKKHIEINGKRYFLYLNPKKLNYQEINSKKR